MDDPRRGTAFMLGDWRVDPSIDEIARDGETIKLEPRKMGLLVALAAHVGEVVTTDQLLEAVWPGLVVTQSSIYQSVAQLRKTLGDDPAAPTYIATVPRKGYRLIATVAPVAEPVPAAAPVPTIVRPARRRWMIASGVAVGAASAAGAGWWWRRPPPVTLPVRLAVLPLTDESPGGIEQPVADGIAEDVIRRLERVEAVMVTARTSAFTIRRVADDRTGLELARTRLHADYALQGELSRSREKLRVALRLASVAGGEPLWRTILVHPVAQLATLPATIADGVMAAFGLPVPTPSSLDSLEAYELYLLGRSALEGQRTMEGIRKARDYFQHAIDVDPGYARAYAGAALTWVAQAGYGSGIDFREATARAQPLLDKALTLAPDGLDGLIAQGRVHTMTSWTEGQRARDVMQKAVALHPGNAEALAGLGLSYAYDEQPREAIRHYARAAALDPLNYAIQARWGIDAIFAGDPKSADEHFAAAAALQPVHPFRHLGPAWLAYAQGRLDEAATRYRQQFEIDARRPDAWEELGWIALDLGLPDRARDAFARQRALTGGAYGAVGPGFAALREGRPVDAGPALAGLPELERQVLLACVGRVPPRAAIEALARTMRADGTPWVGSFYVFQGWLAWIDLAMLHRAAGAAEAARPLLDEADAMLRRLRDRGNVFPTIPFLEARIAGLRDQRDVVVQRLAEAVDGGWRRGWMVAHDPAFSTVRDDPRLAPLLARIDGDMATQRTRLAAG